MLVRLTGALLLVLLAHCGLCSAYIYNYCQAPLPRYIPPPVKSTELVWRSSFPNSIKSDGLRFDNVEQVQVSVFTRHGDRSPTMPLPLENVEWVCGATDDVEIVGGGVPDLGPMKRNIYIDPANPFSFVRGTSCCMTDGPGNVVR